MPQKGFLLLVFFSVTQLDTCDNRRLSNSHSHARATSSNDSSLATTLPSHQTASGHFWANTSLEGLSVKCSNAQRRCLDVRRVLDPVSGKCYPVGDERPCSSGSWALDGNALANGNLLGLCHQPPPCENYGYRMAFDGQCYNITYVNDALCAGRGDAVVHPLGGMECALALESAGSAESPPGTNSSSRRRRGRCALPRLRWQLPRGRVRNDAGAVRCAVRQRLPAPGGGCVMPLRRGFCAAGQHAVIDVEALRGGRLRACCAPHRICPHGEMLLRGKCRTTYDIDHSLSPQEVLVQLPTGEWEYAGGLGSTVVMMLNQINENEFDFSVIIVNIMSEGRVGFAVDVPGRECAKDDDNFCITDVEGRSNESLVLETEELLF